MNALSNMDTNISLKEMTPRQTRKAIERTLKARRTHFVKSSPGLGKSSIVRQIAKDYNLKVIEKRLVTMVPEDFSGLPRFTAGADGREYAQFVPFQDVFPLEHMDIPVGYDGWLLFLDEFNQGEREVQAAAYQPILDHSVGLHKLHERCMIVCAGNLDTDHAHAKSISTAMQSRLIHSTMKEDLNDWSLDVANPNAYDHRLQAFINYKPSFLMNFRANHNDNTFSCPRTLEFFNDVIKGETIVAEDAPYLSGITGLAMATEFVQFVAVYEDKEFPSIQSILDDPHEAHVPRDKAIAFAILSSIIEHLDRKNLTTFSVYADRFMLPMRIMFYRSMVHRYPEILGNPDFAASIKELVKYLK